MLPKGTISKVLDWFITSPEFEEEHARAFEEFQFDVCGGNPRELRAEVFNEWLMFEFVFPDGKTLLQTYLGRHWEGMSVDEQRRYRDLIRTNQCSVYECVDVQPSEWVELRDVRDDVRVRALEKSASQEMKKGMYILTRIAQTVGHWEIVSAAVMPLERDEYEAVEGFIRATKQPWTFATLWGTLIEVRVPPPRWDELIRRKDTLPSREILQQMETHALDRLMGELKKARLDRFFSRSEIETHIKAPGGDQNMVMMFNMRYLDKHSPNTLHRMNGVIRALQTYVNLVVYEGKNSAFNLLLVGAIETRHSQKPRTNIDFEALCRTLLEAYQRIERSTFVDPKTEVPDLRDVSAYAINWCVMENPFLLMKRPDAQRFEMIALCLGNLFRVVTHDEPMNALNIEQMSIEGTFRSVNDFLATIEEAFASVCMGLRDPSIMAVDPEHAPEEWNERLNILVNEFPFDDL